ncbi:Rossmann-like and DUF2520 domain-containing protein [Aneurinibacillus sp. REN35]|uniref:Rossmann-like and DUF2520 domain-containing protein n=1 Tax=Aneurinibacillus sp. REN35 TaxID=3237286 RepID=UPI003527F7F6
MTAIGLVGAGKVGVAFGLYLTRRQEKVCGYYSRTYEHARQAAELVGANAQAFSRLSALIAQSDWIAITTNDTAIENVARSISASGIALNEKVIFHMSGAATSALLAPLAAKGAVVASLHPLQTFADANSGANAMKKAMFGIEGDEEAVALLTEWVERLGHAYFVLEQKQKPLYHAAASIASNSLVGVIGYAVELMKAAGVKDTQALKALTPLIEATVYNVVEKGAEQALTGPIARGDISTVRKHMDAILKTNPDLLDFYASLGSITLAVAKRNALQDKQIIDEFTRLFE